MIDNEKLKEFIKLIGGMYQDKLDEGTITLNDEHKKILLEWYIKENAVIQKPDIRSQSDFNKDEGLTYEEDLNLEELESATKIEEMTEKQFRSLVTDAPLKFISFENLNDIYNAIQESGFKILKLNIDDKKILDKINGVTNGEGDDN